MNILNFMQRFPDEASCIAYLKEQREQSGIVCKHCGCTEHRRIPTNLFSSASTAITGSHYVQEQSWNTASCHSVTG